MRFKRWIVGASLLLLLCAASAVGWHLGVDVHAQSAEGQPTALGEPVRAAGPAIAATPGAPVPGDWPPLPSVGSSTHAYLPLVYSLVLGPEAQGVVDLVNAERVSAGCGPLAVSLQLTSAAQGHSQDMALNDFFSHTSSDGRSPWDRIRETGYAFYAAAENIAAGYSSAESAVTAWMNSSGHRANILNCRLEETGVGYVYLQNDAGSVNYHHYWTQVFATRR